MSNEHHELINEIVTLVHGNIDDFGAKWNEFCQSVENCIGPLKKWASDRDFQESRRKAQKSLAYRCLRFSNKFLNYDKELSKLDNEIEAALRNLEVGKEKNNQKVIESWDVESKQKVRKYAQTYGQKKAIAIASKKAADRNETQRQSFIEQNRSSLLKYFINCEDLEKHGSFLAPIDVIIPTEWFFEHIYQRGPDGNEQLLCDYTLLSIAHDSNAPARYPRVYNQKTYNWTFAKWIEMRRITPSPAIFCGFAVAGSDPSA